MDGQINVLEDKLVDKRVIVDACQELNLRIKERLYNNFANGLFTAS
jgi:hypothetical protein